MGADDPQGPKGPPRVDPNKATFPDLDEAMKLKHPRPSEKVPTLSDVPTAELFDEDEASEFTPIHNIVDLGASLGAIKRASTAMAVDMGHVRGSVDAQGRKLDEVGDRTVNLQARQKTSEARLKVLEADTKVLSSPRPHDCHQGDDIEDIRDEGRQTRLEVQSIASRVAVTETQVETNKEKLKEDGEKTDKRWGRVWGVGITLGIFVLAAVGGWVATLFTLRADVQHLGTEQTKLRATVAKGQASTKASATKMTASAAKMTEATTKMAKTPDAAPPPDPLELLWCELSDHEKVRQKRIRGRDKIPTVRCPR